MRPVVGISSHILPKDFAPAADHEKVACTGRDSLPVSRDCDRQSPHTRRPFPSISNESSRASVAILKSGLSGTLEARTGLSSCNQALALSRRRPRSGFGPTCISKCPYLIPEAFGRIVEISKLLILGQGSGFAVDAVGDFVFHPYTSKGLLHRQSPAEDCE